MKCPRYPRKTPAVVAVILTLGMLLAPLAADAQQAAKTTRLGWLLGGTPASHSRLLDAFRQGLRELGWGEGQSIVIEYRFAEGNYDRLPDLAAELVRVNVDVIVVAGTAGTQAAKNATRMIPIVMVAVGDPVGSGLVASLARPGSNITGLTFVAGLEIVGKNLELLKETVPRVSRVAILKNPAHPAHPLVVREAEIAARSLGVQLQVLEARSPEEFDGAFRTMTRGQAGALVVLADSMFLVHRTRLAQLAEGSRLPAIYGFREHVEAGGLMYYGPSVANQYQRAAVYVDKILRGAKPADLPVEQPTKFELVINLKTAKALGLTIPQSMFIRADEVIQ